MITSNITARTPIHICSFEGFFIILPYLHSDFFNFCYVDFLYRSFFRPKGLLFYGCLHFFLFLQKGIHMLF